MRKVRAVEGLAMRKPTNRELGTFLPKVPARMPGMPYPDHAVRIQKVPYNGGDRFQLTFKDPGKGPKPRCKWWYRNWRHALAASLYVNQKLAEAAGNTDYTYKDAADLWIAWQRKRAAAKEPELGPRGLHSYEHDLEITLERFGSMRLRDITSDRVADWRDNQLLRYKRKTFSGHLFVVRSVLLYAQTKGLMAQSPLVRDPVKLKGKRTKRADIPDRSDMETLRAGFIDRPRQSGQVLTWSSMRVAIAIAANCGLRPSELCGLRWDNVDIDTGEIEVIDVIEGYPVNKPRPYGKTDAARRKVPTTFRTRDIIAEHAEIYREFFGDPTKSAGYVIRALQTLTPFRGNKGGQARSPGGGRPYMLPCTLSTRFANIMRDLGLAKEDGKPKFPLYALRHWAASIFVKHLDIHKAAQLIGHQNASMTLDVYGHCIDDPDTREKIERMPDWLEPLPRIGAPRRPALLPPAPAPVEVEINGADGIEVLPEPACPIDLLDIAEPWLAEYVSARFRGFTHVSACKVVHKTSQTVRAELQRLKMPRPKDLGRRLEAKRILQLNDQGYLDRDIARMVGCTPVHVSHVRKAVLKPSRHKPLKDKGKVAPGHKPDTRPEHKSQLKLL